MKQAGRTVLTSVVLLVLAGAVSALVFFGVRAPRAEEEARRNESLFLVPESFPPFERVAIERPDEPLPIVLEKESGRWRLTSPVDAPAEGSEVAAFLLVLRALSSQTEVVPAEAVAETDLAPFGLDEPYVSLTLEGAGAVRRVFFGNISPFDRRLFCRAEDGPVLLVDGNARFTLERRVLDFREKRVMRFQDPQVELVDVELFDRSYRLERRQPGEWHLSAGFQDRADTSEVSRLLALLRGIRAIGFPPREIAPELDFENPVARVRVGLEGGAEPLEMVVAAHLDGEVRRHIARGTGLAELVELPGEALRSLDIEPVRLRYRQVLHFEQEEVMRLEIGTEEGRYLIERSEGNPPGWRLVSPAEGEIEPWRISSILSTLFTLDAQEVIVESVQDPERELAPLGLAPPQLTVRLLGRDDLLLDALEVGFRSEEPGQRYATNAKRGRVFTIPEARLGNLPRSLEDILAEGALPTAHTPGRGLPTRSE